MAEPLAYEEDRIVYEGANWATWAAPGRLIFVECWHSGKKQTLAIDPDDVDEFAAQLHKAKRYARKSKSGEAGP